MTAYRIVFVMTDDSRETAAAGVEGIDHARRLASTLMPPIGYLRPEAVELVPGTLTKLPGAEAEWADSGGRPVDSGLVGDRGGIAWSGGPEPVPSPTADAGGGIDQGFGEALQLFAEPAPAVAS